MCAFVVNICCNCSKSSLKCIYNFEHLKLSLKLNYTFALSVQLEWKYVLSHTICNHLLFDVEK